MGKLKIFAAAGTFLPAAFILYCVPPEEGGFYPRCKFHCLTGLHCPGCGATRCLHAVLHGDLAQAAAYNVLALLLVVPVSIWLIQLSMFAFTAKSLFSWRFPPWSIWLLISIGVAFGVLRNLPFAPFNELAPHRL